MLTQSIKYTNLNINYTNLTHVFKPIAIVHIRHNIMKYAKNNNIMSYDYKTVSLHIKSS